MRSASSDWVRSAVRRCSSVLAVSSAVSASDAAEENRFAFPKLSVSSPPNFSWVCSSSTRIRLRLCCVCVSSRSAESRRAAWSAVLRVSSLNSASKALRAFSASEAASAAASNAAEISFSAESSACSAAKRVSAFAASLTTSRSCTKSEAISTSCASNLRTSVLALSSSCSSASLAALSRAIRAAAINCSSRLGSSSPDNSSAWRMDSEALICVSPTAFSRSRKSVCALSNVSSAACQRFSQSRALYSWISPASLLYRAACRDWRRRDSNWLSICPTISSKRLRLFSAARRRSSASWRRE